MVVRGSTLLPLVADDEILVFLLGFVLGISVLLLQKPQEFLLISFHLGEVVIGEFAPLLFDSPFDFLPFPFQNIFIHVCSPFLREALHGRYTALRPLSLIHISEPTRLGMISYAVFCLKKKKKK